MATTTVQISGRRDGIGYRAMRWIAVGMLALLALGATLQAADAKGASNAAQNGFVRACRESNGRPERIGSRHVRCTLNDGATVSCNFNYDPPLCRFVDGDGIVIWHEQTNDVERFVIEAAQAPVFDVSAPETGGGSTDTTGAEKATFGTTLNEEQP